MSKYIQHSYQLNVSKQSARLAFSIEFWKNLQESCRFIYINYEILSNYKKKGAQVVLQFWENYSFLQGRSKDLYRKDFTQFLSRFTTQQSNPSRHRIFRKQRQITAQAEQASDTTRLWIRACTGLMYIRSWNGITRGSSR